MKEDWKQDEYRLEENQRMLNELKEKLRTLEQESTALAKSIWKNRYEYIAECRSKLEQLVEKREEEAVREKTEIQEECKKLGHVYYVEDEDWGIVVGTTYSVKRTETIIKKCIVCGATNTSRTAYYRLDEIPNCPDYSIPEVPEEHQKMIAKVRAKHTEKLDVEINELRAYIDDIASETCKNFGHYLTDSNNGICKCCKKYVSTEEYRKNRAEAKYGSLYFMKNF